jgi:transcription elongation factor GreB
MGHYTSNGDRSENADYLYGKRRLGQIDSRIRFLTKRIDAAVVVDPAAPRSGSAATRVFFGATVTYKDAAGLEHVVSIVGIDEVEYAPIPMDPFREPLGAQSTPKVERS